MSLEKISDCNRNNKQVVAHLPLKADFSAGLNISPRDILYCCSNCTVLGQKIIQRHEKHLWDLRTYNYFATFSYTSINVTKAVKKKKILQAGIIVMVNHPLLCCSSSCVSG